MPSGGRLRPIRVEAASCRFGHRLITTAAPILALKRRDAASTKKYARRTADG
jgi:hypothetical protein